ncbi:unnamed protein product [Trifolium pratense]|uniref:Uncharacterized protein n=1 Tax=Trifolium pratense TaxID=57577 RepID=A0ACB0K5H8_TRIPR|nr:unnamed protein product [Trifolium pratense]
MENWQDQHDALKGEVAQLTEKLDKALELLINLNKPAQPVVVETAVPAPQGGTSAVNSLLRIGYTPQNRVEVQQSPQNTHTRVPLVQQGFVSQQENLDDPRNAYQSLGLFDDVPKVNSNVPQLEEARQKFKAIEDRLSMMEGGGDPIDLANMCLVPDLVLPPKFKVPDFEKYKDSLTGASLNWYMQLEGNRIQSWRDLANAFIKQYQYNIDMAPDRTQLQNMSQEEGESFRVYAKRWRELAAQVHPPLLEAELVDIFTNTLQGAYFEKMVGSVSSGFSDMVKIGERIEMGIKSGKIQATVGNQCTSKDLANSFTKMKEEETNAATPKRKVFDLIPMSYGQLLPYLVHNGMVIPRALKPMTPPFPAWYDDKAKCEFHMGAEGHSIDNCIAFKHLVQELIDGKVLTFKDGKPNVKDSPLLEAV